MFNISNDNLIKLTANFLCYFPQVVLVLVIKIICISVFYSQALFIFRFLITI